MLLGIVFNGSMEYRVCVCGASFVGKERSKETKWSYGKVEKVFLQLNARAKSVIILRHCWMYERDIEKINVEVTVILWFWLFGEKHVCPQKMLPRGEVVTRCRSESGIAVDIANFGGDVKLFLWVAYWMYLIHIQLGILGLRKITKESMNKAASLMVPCCCCYWRADGRRL